MNKYYVESGADFRMIVLAENPVDAILRSFAATADRMIDMAEVIIVNERGFVWERPGKAMHGDEHVYPTMLLLDPPDEVDIAG